MIRRLLLSTEADWVREMGLVGADPGSWDRVRHRSEVIVLRTGPMPSPAANILKQCMLSSGGDAIVARGVIDCSCDSSCALLVGMPRHLRHAAESLLGQPFGLSAISAEITRLLSPRVPAPVRSSPCARPLVFGQVPLVMGILNVTEDSFSDGGLYLDPDAAVRRGMQMAEEGADIIDAGAESTRPGSVGVPPSVQTERLVPVLRALRRELPSMPISVDTSSAEAAAAALDEGADIVNDVRALADPAMAPLAAARGACVILVHMKGAPADMQVAPCYADVIEEVSEFLAERVGAAVSAGIEPDRIMVDPGIGFGKRLEDNILLLRRLGELAFLGRRIVVGYSRKRFLGALTGIEDPAGRDRAGHAVAALCAGAADIIRVHDVSGTKAVLRTAAALTGEASC